MAGVDMVKRRDDKVEGRKGLERFTGAWGKLGKGSLAGP